MLKSYEVCNFKSFKNKTRFDLEKTNYQTLASTNVNGNVLIKADGDRLVEVIQNIIENAIKYGDGRYIGLSAHREEDEFLIEVENTGCELEEAEEVHIFDSFYRGSNVGSQPGSGLGLYICRKLIHAMEGEIFAEIKEDTYGRKMCVKVALRLA